MRTINELMSLKGRKAIVTGATGGLGEHIATTIIELGGDLILVDRPGSDYSSLLSELEENDIANIQCFDCDLENEDERKNLIA